MVVVVGWEKKERGEEGEGAGWGCEWMRARLSSGANSCRGQDGGDAGHSWVGSTVRERRKKVTRGGFFFSDFPNVLQLTDQKGTFQRPKKSEKFRDGSKTIQEHFSLLDLFKIRQQNLI